MDIICIYLLILIDDRLAKIFLQIHILLLIIHLYHLVVLRNLVEHDSRLLHVLNIGRCNLISLLTNNCLIYALTLHHLHVHYLLLLLRRIELLLILLDHLHLLATH